ncbi:MAG: hypothetical protein QM286_08645 [Acidobacteriota bacterium]|nr:hypothetical protein [Acidobacteriota bacterium]
MTWRPELVALDIDGTLVDRQGNLPLDVKSAVQLSIGGPGGRVWCG